MRREMSRRDFVRFAALTGSAAVAGFDPHSRSWILQGENRQSRLQGLPALDGTLSLDLPTRTAIAVDGGNMYHRIPAAVLRPGSVKDVVRMVRYANRHSLKIATKGDGHSRWGQTQADAGIVIDSRSLGAIEMRGATSVDVQPGAFWGGVTLVTIAKSLTPKVVPANCMALTVGGTLSVGGVGASSHRYGALVDNVIELDVVTGDGRLVTCSLKRESELFNMVLAGQGQCGIIVRARIPLMAAPTHVSYRELVYSDLGKYLTDQQRLLGGDHYESQRGRADRKSPGGWSFSIELGRFLSTADQPEVALAESGMQFDSATAPVRMTYRDFLFRWEAANAVSTRPSPYIAMWIPASAAKDFLSGILALPPEALGVWSASRGESISLYPMNTRRFSRPLFKVPTEERAFAVWLFRSVAPGDETALAAMKVSNREVLEKMTAVGGKRYSVYSSILSPAEWTTHFGADLWKRFAAAKRKYDPNHVLSPSPAIFA